MNQEFIGALKEIVKDKGISEDLLFTTIEDALVAAYKKNYAGPTSSAQNVKVTIDRETGEIHVYSQKVVVEEVFDNVTEIGLDMYAFARFRILSGIVAENSNSCLLASVWLMRFSICSSNDLLI